MKNILLNNRVLLLGGVGGHGEQITRIRKMLDNSFSYHLITEYGMNWNFPDGVTETYRIVHYHKPSKIKSFFFFLIAFLKAIKVILIFRPNACVSTGPALMIPVALACKICGVSVVHIESWSRISSVSNTTKLLLKYSLVSKVFYQYETSILKDCEIAEYCGHL